MTYNIGDGNFEYIIATFQFQRRVFQITWKAITMTDTWDYIANLDMKKAYIQSPDVARIWKKMKELGCINLHWFFFWHVLQFMRHLAVFGEETFKIAMLRKVNCFLRTKAYRLCQKSLPTKGKTKLKKTSISKETKDVIDSHANILMSMSFA